MKVQSWALSEVGRIRDRNEDAFFRDDHRGVYAIADGVGGGPRGQVASRKFVEMIQAGANALQNTGSASNPSDARRRVIDCVTKLFQDASQIIYEETLEQPELTGMSTTGVLVAMFERNAVVGHVGHSRAYLVRDGRLTQLTTDHTLAQALMDKGALTPDRAARSRHRNLLTRAVGKLPDVEVDVLWLDLLPGDSVLLCTDGLYGQLEEGELTPVLDPEAGGQAFLRNAVEMANQRSGKDNITGLLVATEPSEEDVSEDASVGAHLDSQACIEHLKRIFLFKYLSHQEMLKILRIVYQIHCQAGEIIVREGAPGDRMYVVADGTVRVSKEGVYLTTLPVGDHFGEVSFVDNRPRSATVEATTPTTLLTISRNDFLDLARSEPRLSTKLLWCLVQNLSHRLREISRDFVDGSREVD